MRDGLSEIFGLVDPDQHDHEQEQRHHRPGVNDDLNRRHEVSQVENVEDPHRKEGGQQTHCRIDGVASPNHGQGSKN